MVGWYKRLITAIAAIVLLLGTGTVAHAVGGEQAVLVPGAMAFKQINPIYPLLRHFLYPNIGINFHTDPDPQLIDYSQDPLASDRAIRQGVERATAAVREIDGKVVVIGESMGSMVAARVATELAASDHPPSVGDIRFVLIAPPEAGAAEYFKEGTFIPILNYRVSRIPESPYLTTIVIGEYDGWADPPDRPWNLVSLLNSVLGALLFVHGQTSLADPADVPPENIAVEKNSQGAEVTTYFAPTENLPLTQVFRLFIPGALVDIADQILRPVVDVGYIRHDQPGDRRPYLSEGRIIWPQRVDCVSEDAAPEPVEVSGAALTSADEPGLTAARTPAESSGGSAPASVDATQLATDEPEPEAEVQDDSSDTVDLVEDVPEIDETETAPEPELQDSAEMDTEQEETETGTQEGSTPAGPDSITENGATSDDTVTAGSSSPAPIAGRPRWSPAVFALGEHHATATQQPCTRPGRVLRMQLALANGEC